MKINLPQNVEKIIKIAKKNGYSAFAVGGCVRDNLLGKKAKDWDITISSPPHETKRIFSSYKTVDTGIKYGTVSVIIDSETYEVTTFRGEKGYSDFRHPEEIYFSDDITDDLKRRDFTVNAMAYNPNMGLIDLYGGRIDLENKIIRCVGNPMERFSEDPLRILRGIRFASTYGFKIEDTTKYAIFFKTDLLKNISKERIKSEFDKMFLNSQNNAKYLKEYSQAVKVSLETNDISLAEKYIDKTKNLSVKWALILAESNINILKLPNSLKKDCNVLKEFITKSLRGDLIETKYMVKKYGMEMCGKIAEFKKAMGEDTTQVQKNLKKIKENKLCCTLKELNVSGRDLIEQGFNEKEKYKDILDFLLNLVIEEKCENNKEKLLEFIMKPAK